MSRFEPLNQLVRRWCRRLLAPTLGALVLPALAADLSVSGFGTLGYARSDQPFGYLRFIDSDGTFKRDSIVGLQVDAALTHEFGATVQVKAAPATGNDTRIDGTAAWAFFSYRPSNDLLFRIGKQRIPLYLYSATVDVGVTYDFARLPSEMYSILSTNDFTGFTFSKNWRIYNGELSIDGGWGRSKHEIRYWLRDSIPGLQNAGASFVGLDIQGRSFLLTYSLPGQTLRIGVFRSVLRRDDATTLVVGYPFVTLAPGIGYFQVNDASTVANLTNTLYTLGAEVDLPSDFRLIGEFARSVTPGAIVVPQGNRGYVSLSKRIGKWHPYVAYSAVRSPTNARNFYSLVNENTVPVTIAGAALVNASQRAGADRILVDDQQSLAVGASYSISSASKIKAEYAHTRVGVASTSFDVPPGSNSRGQRINVFTLSYSFVF